METYIRAHAYNAYYLGSSRLSKCEYSFRSEFKANLATDKDLNWTLMSFFVTTGDTMVYPLDEIKCKTGLMTQW